VRLFAAVLALVALALSGGPAAAQTRAPQNVLTIHSGAADYLVNPVIDAGIRQGLFSASAHPIDYFTEYLDFDRFSNVEASAALADYVQRKYAGRQIHLVIAVTNRSLRFVVEHRATLFPDAGIVFAAAGVADAELDRSLGRGMTGVRAGSAYAETLKLALILHPATEQVFVVAISPNQRNVEAVHEELQPFSRDVRLRYLEAESMPALQAKVKAIPRRSLILYIWYQRKGSAYVTDSLQPARLVAETAGVPVYGVVDANVGTGIVGGIVRGTRETGTLAGQMARRILNGARAESIPIEYAPVIPMFDWRQLQRWKIDPAHLPPGSDIRFKVPTVWEAYRWYIAGALVVMTVQLVLIAGLLRQRACRRRAEETLRANQSTLRTSYDRIRQLAGRLINVQEMARAALARDLHDDVCQELAGVAMMVSGLKRSTGSVQDARTQRTLSELERSTRVTVESVRRLSHELHPVNLRVLGLAAALKGHCREVEKRHDVPVIFTTEGDVAHLPADVAVCLFRVAQEALRNGAVHGGPRQIRVSLAGTDAAVELTVTDDGRGFDLEAARGSGSGLGLVSIEERGRAVGGSVEIRSQPRQGTTIRVRVPTGAAIAAPQPYAPPKERSPFAQPIPAAGTLAPDQLERL
jgi:signal transduction histidine kinase